MLKLVIIGCGGFLGAIARYGVSGWLQNLSGGRFPIGTLSVNLVGCALLGGIMAAVQGGLGLSPALRNLVTIGFLGSFTTFSTFGYETVELMREGDWLRAAVNAGLHLVLGLLAVALGAILAKGLWLRPPG